MLSFVETELNNESDNGWSTLGIEVKYPDSKERCFIGKKQTCDKECFGKSAIMQIDWLLKSKENRLAFIEMKIKNPEPYKNNNQIESRLWVLPCAKHGTTNSRLFVEFTDNKYAVQFYRHEKKDGDKRTSHYKKNNKGELYKKYYDNSYLIYLVPTDVVGKYEDVFNGYSFDRQKIKVIGFDTLINCQNGDYDDDPLFNMIMEQFREIDKWREKKNC